MATESLKYWTKVSHCGPWASGLIFNKVICSFQFLPNLFIHVIATPTSETINNLLTHYRMSLSFRGLRYRNHFWAYAVVTKTTHVLSNNQRNDQRKLGTLEIIEDIILKFEQFTCSFSKQYRNSSKWQTVDPDQTAQRAIWFESAVFAKTCMSQYLHFKWYCFSCAFFIYFLLQLFCLRHAYNIRI